MGDDARRRRTKTRLLRPDVSPPAAAAAATQPALPGTEIITRTAVGVQTDVAGAVWRIRNYDAETDRFRCRRRWAALGRRAKCRR